MNPRIIAVAITALSLAVGTPGDAHRFGAVQATQRVDRLQKRLHLGDVITGLRFAPGGRRLAVETEVFGHAGERTSTRILDTRTWKGIASLAGERIQDYTRDGRYFMTARAHRRYMRQEPPCAPW